MKARDEIECAGWTSIDNLIGLLADVVYKFAEKSDVSPHEMRKYIDKQLDTIENHAVAIKLREVKDVHMRELSADVRLP